MHLNNIEREFAFNIRPDWKRNRRAGLSAFVRVKDEAEYIEASLNSIAGWCDEIVIAIQGYQSDGTDKIVKSWAGGRDSVVILEYPFESSPNGPGHDQQKRGSVYERAYFYNWTLSQTSRSHVIKWDGDMVAMDDAHQFIAPGLFRGGCRFHGVEIADKNYGLSAVPATAHELRMFRVGEGTFYETGPVCERLYGVGSDVMSIERPMFLHFKWAKQRKSATKAWPDNWREFEHFRNIMKRSTVSGQYKGPVPSALHG